MTARHYAPNILTILRIVLSTYLLLLISRDASIPLKMDTFLTITKVTGFIYATDFLDGRLARRLRCSSAHGALLDVSADLYYILGQCIVLICKHALWTGVLYCVLIEFTVFMISCRFIKTEQNTPITYDWIGRAVAVYYYGIPYVVILVQFLGYPFVLPAISSGCFMLTAAAVGHRIELMKKQRTAEKYMDKKAKNC